MTRRFHIATLLLAGMLMAACSEDTDLVTRATEGDAVPLQLAVSIGTPASTRMSDETVQLNSKFRGITDIHLIPFGTDNITSTTTKLGDFLSLEKLLKPNTQTVNNALPKMTSQNTALYKDVNIPIGTKGFLFYGMATQDNSITDPHVQGRLTAQITKDNTVTSDWSNLTTPSQLTFSLQSIKNSSDTPKKATRLAEYMTNIANAKTTSGTAWADYTTGTEIQELHKSFIKNIAGSSNSIQALLQDLYTNLNTNYSSDDMALAIIKQIKVGADIDANNKLTLNTDYAGYPGNLGLPDGTASMSWNKTDNKFEPFSGTTGTGTGSISVSDLTDFVYPPCLYYRVNTGVKTSSSAQQNNYNDTNSWDDIAKLYTSGDKVDGTTKSVALTNAIQYAVGRYDVTVKCSDATLPDKNNTNVTVPAEGFPVSAVFVAGQKSVDWEFKPQDNDVDWIIYDNKIGDDIYAKYTTTGDKSETTHTLVLETAANAAITVALELENTTGLPFTGYDGQMIYAGSKFYLVGTLKPTKATDKVFEQDNITTANYNITSLANAYNVIPDLRAPHLELGISIVDSWSSAGTDSVALE